MNFNIYVVAVIEFHKIFFTIGLEQYIIIISNSLYMVIFIAFSLAIPYPHQKDMFCLRTSIKEMTLIS